MAGVGFDPIPLRATHFKCMTECKRTGANGYLAEYEDLMGKDKKATCAALFHTGEGSYRKTNKKSTATPSLQCTFLSP